MQVCVSVKIIYESVEGLFVPAHRHNHSKFYLMLATAGIAVYSIPCRNVRVYGGCLGLQKR